MPLQSQDILRNLGRPLGKSPGPWEKKMLISRGGRKQWVTYVGETHAEAVQGCLARCEEVLLKWETRQDG